MGNADAAGEALPRYSLILMFRLRLLPQEYHSCLVISMHPYHPQSADTIMQATTHEVWIPENVKAPKPKPSKSQTLSAAKSLHEL